MKAKGFQCQFANILANVFFSPSNPAPKPPRVREVNTALHFSILETAGEQSPKNANLFCETKCTRTSSGRSAIEFHLWYCMRDTRLEENCYHLSRTLQMVLRAAQHKAMCSLIMWWILQWKPECFLQASADSFFFFFLLSEVWTLSSQI